MNILIAGGGTGGHINPALAIGGYLRKMHPDWKIAYAGDPDKMEGRLVPAAGFELLPIHMTGLSRRVSWDSLKHNLKTLGNTTRALKAADRMMETFSPDLVIGVGGYVSYPVLRQAVRRGVKTMIHEQNAFPGVTTKTLSGKADVVLLPNERAGERLPKAHHAVVVGNPVRDEFIYSDRAAARRKLGLGADEKLIVSSGGSLGAKVFNQAMFELFCNSAELTGCRFVHSTGRGAYAGFCAALEHAGVPYNTPEAKITVYEYISEMPTLLAAADLCISRAGASALAELAVCGTPAILIPSPNVTENHQYHNAKLIEQGGAALVLTEDKLTAQSLLAAVVSLMGDPDRLRAMRAAQHKLAIYDVCDRIYEQIKLLMGL